VGRASQGSNRSDQSELTQDFHFFNSEEVATFVTRCVSEGNRLISLAYAAGYEELLLAYCEKVNGPARLHILLDIRPPVTVPWVIRIF